MVDTVKLDGAALVAEARKAASQAYAPYSKFAVGAAVLLAGGRIVRGANFENASYGLSLCAETVALAAVNMAGGLRDVVAVAVVGGAIGTDGLAGSTPVYPCGRCRQVLNEAAQLGSRDFDIFCASADGHVIEKHRLSTLLPHAFGPADLLSSPAYAGEQRKYSCPSCPTAGSASRRWPTR